MKEDNGYPLTVREICIALGFKSTSSASYYLDRLEQKGYILRDRTKPRTIEVLKRTGHQSGSNVEDYAYGFIYTPVIGDVAAGMPILAQQNIDSYCPLPKADFGSGNGLYMLRVHGNSMINAGIFDGDKVIAKSCDTAEDGEIVVALVEDSETIKRFYKENGYYRLQAENDAMEPIFVNVVQIQGVVVGVLRTLKRLAGR